RLISWNPAGAAAVFYGRLKNNGGTLTLRAAAGTTLDSADYAKGFPWPTVGDPPNCSIELINPALDNSLGGNWRRSDAVGPGGFHGAGWGFAGRDLGGGRVGGGRCFEQSR
ncbi:MAG: hypothetical protein JWL81_1342, partial [Verrucomicrobiales bacterium]|nr:hypothetical protein [Verrucomicrobiales bacterium]